MSTPQHRPAEAFFLPTDRGRRYCLFHPAWGACRGALLYVHPFAEEMNRTRRMAALQARELADLGYAVLQIDLYGCGDSDGDFVDARWQIWKDDIAAASAWLRVRSGQAVGLWGLRLGALLALDYARSVLPPPAHLLLWQPVHSGSAFLTNFLRLRTSGDLLAGGSETVGETQLARAALRSGATVEIGGYELAGELAAAIDAIDAAALAPLDCAVDWFEIVPNAELPMAPGSSRVAATWHEQGTLLRLHTVHCPPFWATQEVLECPPLLAATGAALREAARA